MFIALRIRPRWRRGFKGSKKRSIFISSCGYDAASAVFLRVFHCCSFSPLIFFRFVDRIVSSPDFIYNRPAEEPYLERAPDVVPQPAANDNNGRIVDLTLAMDEAKRRRTTDPPSVNDRQVAVALQAQFNELLRPAQQPVIGILLQMQASVQQLQDTVQQLHIESQQMQANMQRIDGRLDNVMNCFVALSSKAPHETRRDELVSSRISRDHLGCLVYRVHRYVG
jgi:hypothetical protein